MGLIGSHCCILGELRNNKKMETPQQMNSLNKKEEKEERKNINYGSECVSIFFSMGWNQVRPDERRFTFVVVREV